MVTVSDLLEQSRQFSNLGQFERAAEKCGEIIALEPKNSTAHFQLGLIALKRGRHHTAIDWISRAVALDSSQPNFYNVLGIAHSTVGNLPEGARCFLRVLELDPDNAFAHNNLGGNYKDQEKLTDAKRCFRTAISINPKFVEAYSNLGDLLGSHGELAAAADAYRHALQINADLVGVQFNLAIALHYLEKYEEAATIFRRVATTQPNYPGVYNMLGLTLMRLGKFEEAIANFRETMTREPRSAAPYVNLGHTLHSRNDLQGAISSFRKALTIDPGHAAAHSNLLMDLNYLPRSSQEDLYDESLRYDLRHAAGLLPGEPTFCNSRDQGKVLRIGYVSPDFRAHSVAHFTGKLFGVHDRTRVEVFCYANVMKQDEITKKLKSQADHWLSVIGLTDEDVAVRIRKDQIDILIDLAGHTAEGRLLVFARKPAPIQVTWLGYPNTTGMRAMDYRLTDAVADPPGDADRLYVEKLVRLEHGFLCYQTDHPIPIAAPPCLRQGHITFCSFNTLPKINAEVVRVWSKILQMLPDAQLVLKAGGLADGETRAKFSKMFLKHGIAPERLHLFGMIHSRAEHLGMYSRTDIGLDPFPYNGTTTTCEALWMGVPVVTLRGDRHAGRVGASIMHHVGLSELVAGSEEAYIDLALSLANDAKRLTQLRKTLRSQMRESNLMDVELFTETLEDAYRSMWRTWCDR